MTPAAYTRPVALTPNIRRWMLDRGWIDRRTVTRLERTANQINYAAALADYNRAISASKADPDHVARMYRLLELSPAPGPPWIRWLDITTSR